MKMFHVVVQSDSGKVTVVNLGRTFWPEQISIILIPICRTMTAVQHIVKQSIPSLLIISSCLFCISPMGMGWSTLNRECYCTL